jgi:hypothetical protein
MLADARTSNLTLKAYFDGFVIILHKFDDKGITQSD